ncbi:hypothetical protein MT1_1179 [Pseudomonas sp. MT-1]|uniref:DUF6228 family protein n=1 Tax=Stutzerimonas stutzeri TaxID=316 RepID=UPI0005362770|nr:DUF6228 family protein [Stutzerimonas stutzeri]MCQ4285814.1 DUF6228 family protein [Stutzerimonas stutzeri]BAP78356.1 hypothetical protein MT1_1179 [Pseudomonas sp. MT-1]
MNEVIIKSADTAAQLVLSDIEGDYFTATYKSNDIFVSRRVWGYTDCNLLVDLFSYMAKEWKGWDGEINWASIEQELSITCTSDQKGHIEVKLKLSKYEDAEPWEAQVVLNLESGVMEKASKDVKAFFHE